MGQYPSKLQDVDEKEAMVRRMRRLSLDKPDFVFVENDTREWPSCV
jgi:hypothetical protein